jgi:AcrR family transcriptional regulator
MPRYSRPQRVDSTETETSILDAAEALVRANAFHVSTMDEIARQSGVSRATVFTRFGSKLGILEALATRCAGGPEIGALVGALQLQDPVAALEAVVTASCVVWERQGFIMEHLNAIVVLEPSATRSIEQQREFQSGACNGLALRLADAGRLSSALSPAAAGAALHAILSLESFLLLRRNSNLSLPEVTSVIVRLASAILSPEGRRR